MSKPQSPAAFRAEVPGLSYFLPELSKAPPAPAPVLSAPLAALEQMFGYYG
ncbi:hypothetical protein [Stagnihabitans tardus]|uniref:Uncharacterized protein n=1 Tax=Stagnihabitans tardus TaxID=2699202 RepID=A0AAE4Y9I8_9RHOB|nr:hypothetical protein [Stagnihabitans tardus]NBZ88543.1 hypothetical protein [Stagnihabitans tardus]